MKKTILITALFIIGLATFGNAQEPTSIRSQSLGNIIQDDWDLIYDPIELRFVDGMYFFTNLADFNLDESSFEEIGLWNEDSIMQSQEQIRNDFLKDFPIGLSFKNPLFGFLKHSFLLRLRNSKEAENAYDGEGEYEYSSTNYYDQDGDGLYDTKNISSGKYINYDIDRRSAFILNNNLKMGPMTLGWKLAFDHEISEDDEARTEMGVFGFGDLLHGASGGYWIWDPWYGNIWIEGFNYGFDEATTHYIMEEEYSDYTYAENGDFLTTKEDSYAKSHIAFMIDIGLELRADLINQKLINGRIKTNDYYSGDYTLYDDADMQDYETGTIVETYKSLIEESGSMHQIGGSVKRVFNSRDERKNDGFFQVGTMLGKSFGDYESSSDNQLDWTKNRNYTDTTNTDWSEAYSEHHYHNDIGDITGSSMDLFGRLQVPIGDVINFGIGAFYSYRQTSRETDFVSESTIETEYIYNGNFDDWQDYTETETSKLDADRTYETQVSMYKIPVGLEFSMPDDDLTENDPFSLRNFSFRIGTTFFSTQTIVRDKKQITDSYPYTEIIEYGDGDVSVDIDNNYYKSTSERTENIIGKKRFSVGIGYSHSENLQIDLGGYGDEDDFFAGIAFTLKF